MVGQTESHSNDQTDAHTNDQTDAAIAKAATTNFTEFSSSFATTVDKLANPGGQNFPAGPQCQYVDAEQNMFIDNHEGELEVDVENLKEQLYAYQDALDHIKANMFLTPELADTMQEVFNQSHNHEQEVMTQLDKQNLAKQEEIYQLRNQIVAMKDALEQVDSTTTEGKTAIKKRAQALLTKILELQDSSVPRLVMVLPQNPSEWDATTPFSNNKTLELVQLQLIQARQACDSRDAEIAFAICKIADSLLTPLKAVVKRPHRFRSSSGSMHGIDPEQETALCQEIACAYIEHANLMAELGKADMAQTSRKRADKWGGPGVKQKSIPQKKESRALDVAAVSKKIFPDDIRPPTLPWTFPEPDGRVTDTLQLASCLGLLNHGSERLNEGAVDPAARKWLLETERSEEERVRLKALARDLICAFTNDEIKHKEAVDEIVCIVSVLDKDDYRFLLGKFLEIIEGRRILDFAAVGGLAQILKRSSSPRFLHAQDLIEILTTISTRLQETHTQSPDHIFELTVAVSSVLDAMADTNVSGLDREALHGPLLTFLGSLQGASDLHLKYYASYAFQALLCVPDNESP
ncbi:hypothetical protein BGZ70_000818 [Mortierella alpina]|uniref:Arm-like repeat domain-containing protein n=1 Tax=Mortierella alpina TaxID=64518 RepID=A0A9P6JBY1_MORAP|nr:hypothetical protein BGZ70_000818 [Mortierella alpina]